MPACLAAGPPQPGSSGRVPSPKPGLQPKASAAMRAGALYACDGPYGTYAALLTPQKNGSGPLITPETFFRHA
jgi:hypothetical protein